MTYAFLALETSITEAYNKADTLHKALQNDVDKAVAAAGLTLLDEHPQQIAALQQKADAAYKLRNDLWNLAKNEFAKIENMGQ